MLLGISPDVQNIKKSIRHEMQHLMQIDVSLKWILVMLSITITCRNIHILIRSPLKMKFLRLLWKFHDYIFHGLGEK